MGVGDMARRQTLGRHETEVEDSQAPGDPPIRVLFVGIDRERFDRIRHRLNISTRTPFDVVWVASAAEALRRLDESHVDVVLIDDGVGADRAIRLVRDTTLRPNASPPVILASSLCDPAIDQAAMEAGAVDYLDWRELTPESVRWTIRYAARHRSVVDAARRNAQWFRALVNYGIDGVATLNSEGQLTYVSPSVKRLMGYEDSELLGCHFAGLIHPDDLSSATDAFKRVTSQPGVPVRAKIRVRHASGEWRMQESSTVNLLDEPAVGSIVCHFIDITEHESTQQALGQTQELFRAIFAEALDAILISDNDSRLVLVNRAAGQLFGIAPEDMVGRLGSEFTPETMDYATTWRSFLTDGRMSGAHQIIRRDGTVIDVEFAAVANVLPGRHLSILRDVTRQKAVEEDFRQAQKMEAIGRLAGGIAHDFNNLLTAILGYAELLRETESLPAEVKDDIENIRTAAVSAAGLTQQLLAFSRRQVLQPRVVSLNEVVTRVEALLRRVLGEDIDLKVLLDPRVAYVRGDEVQLDQLLMNLAVNARDAMPRGGHLSIRTRNRILDQGYARTHRDAEPGHYVELSITDTGTGMDENVKSHLFEPFFTTKAEGKGTGLGLATVYGAVKQMGGSIAVDSELHRGTTFRIYLPAIDAESSTSDEPPPRVASFDGNERVLVVEDKDEVRRITSRTLRRHGYLVTEAASPREALQLTKEPGTRFDMLLTDMVMPEMRGRELAHHLRQRIPGLRVVYMSGYADDTIEREGTDAGLVFLQKPFTPQVLLQHVREALDAAEAPPI
jgi:PAS domain S-box-containing protein